MSDDTIIAVLTRLEAGQAGLQAGLAGLEVRQAAFEARQAAFEAGQAALEAGQAGIAATVLNLRVDVMTKIEELQDSLTRIRDDIGVNMGAVDMAREVNDNTRADLKQMREQMSIMWKQLKRLQTDVEDLRGAA